ncbi:Protein kinase-like domain [Cordyceps javanica]|uniref:Protein kinase-like domain n=1 Tax=Cordyceps javanica TaxID=43265 RepID=A0A545W6P5_9HYPO|nr:Protein kinase-like domain [Cordyceps javanica]TQW09661.1 Protein kinase-like domain [Cordyceps javanica]
MGNTPIYDVASWETHITEDDCTLVIRTDNGRVFYCEISPKRFHQSPLATKQYFKCLNILRFGEQSDQYDEDFYLEDACDWLSKPFKPLVERLAPGALQMNSAGLPTLAHYLLSPYFVCSLSATDEQLRACYLPSREHSWGSPLLMVSDDFLEDLQSWTRSFHLSEVGICYDRPQDVLIKPPRRVLVSDGNGSHVECFFKRFALSFGPEHARAELRKLKRLALARIPPPPQAFVCHLYGVVRDSNGLAGMLFSWIESQGVLSRARAEQSATERRRRWAGQIRETVQILHDRNIIWGDVKAENVLIDTDDNAWVIDFGGSYTMGWVDEEIAGTVEGDLQGLSKIMSSLG